MNRVAMWVGSALMAGTAGVFTVTAVFDIKPETSELAQEVKEAEKLDIKEAVREGVIEGLAIDRNHQQIVEAAEIKRNKDRMWGRN